MPCLVAMLETKMASHTPIQVVFNFIEMIEVSVVGQAGGLVILWNHDMVTVNNFTRRGQEIHAMIEEKLKNLTWLFSAIYASNNILDRNILWDNLTNINNYYKGPLMIGGDIKEIIDSRDKFGDRHINQR